MVQQTRKLFSLHENDDNDYFEKSVHPTQFFHSILAQVKKKKVEDFHEILLILI